MVTECFKTLEMSLLSKIRQEMQSELVGYFDVVLSSIVFVLFRHTDQILEGLGSTEAIKGLCEGIHTNVEVLKEWNTDLTDSMAKKLGDIEDKLASPIVSKESLSKVYVSVDKMNSQLTAIKTLIVDALSVLTYDCPTFV